MKRAIYLTLVVVGMFAATEPFAETSKAPAKETSHLVFVTEYIRELAANENARAPAEQELSTDTTPNEKLSSAIHSNTRIQLVLQSQIAMLKPMHLEPSFEELTQNIIEFDQRKIDVHQKMIDISSALLVGPKPEIDYNKMVTDMPKLRAFLDDIDQMLFQAATPMVFATLIDNKPDSQNHLSRLVITRAERAKLVRDLTISFGAKLDQKNQNYIVSSASLLKAFLLKDYKCSDDPWD
jgi:hypothetical protein